MAEVGDLVVVLDNYHPTKMRWGFAGLVAEVVELPDPSIQMWEGYSLVRPLWDRPDDYGRAPFWWSNRDLLVLNRQQVEAMRKAAQLYLGTVHG